MPNKLSLSFVVAILLYITATAQQPEYTFKHFVSTDNPKEFERIIPNKDGLIKSYIVAQTELWDIDNNTTTYVKGGQKVLICVEGQFKNGQREGIFTGTVIDSTDHSKKYKIWEQTFANDKLNGEWRTYTLRGTLVKSENYKNDSLDGSSKEYWIDGKKLMGERIFFNGSNKFIEKSYSETGVIKDETTFEHNEPNGPARKYYPDGVLMDEVILVNSIPNGVRKYYYPSGKIWIETVLKDGKPWTVIANYTEAGQKRNAGTLKEGNGTILLYNNDGTLRDTVFFKNGDVLKQ